MIYLNGYTPDVTVVMKELFKAGYTGAKIAQGYAVNQKLLDSMPAEVSDGTYTATPSPAVVLRGLQAPGQVPRRRPTSIPYSCQCHDHDQPRRRSPSPRPRARPPAPPSRTTSGRSRRAAGTKVDSAVEGLKLLAQGKEINYEGACGPCDFTEIGDILDCKIRFDQADKGKFKLREDALTGVLGEVLQLLLNGLVAGTILAVPAIGFTAIYAVLRFPNFTVASHATIGAFAGYVANTARRLAGRGPRWWWPSSWPARRRGQRRARAEAAAAGRRAHHRHRRHRADHRARERRALRLRQRPARLRPADPARLAARRRRADRPAAGGEPRHRASSPWRRSSCSWPSRAPARRCARWPTIPMLAGIKGIDADRVARLVNFVRAWGSPASAACCSGLDTSIDPLTGFRVILSVFAAAVVGGLGLDPRRGGRGPDHRRSAEELSLLVAGARVSHRGGLRRHPHRADAAPARPPRRARVLTCASATPMTVLACCSDPRPPAERARGGGCWDSFAAPYPRARPIRWSPAEAVARRSPASWSQRPHLAPASACGARVTARWITTSSRWRRSRASTRSWRSG